jgi:cysteine sulfinate desulfinase/cysteine desulfurase-like protein
VAVGLSVISMGRQARMRGRGHIVASPMERAAVLTSLRCLREEGSSVSFMSCDGNGRTASYSLREMMTDKTGLVVVTWGSAVSGTIQPVEALAQVARERGAAFLTDAAEVAGRLEIDLSKTMIDAMVIASHKLGSYPGVGAVISSVDDPLLMTEAPELSGPGNLSSIAAMMAALKVTCTGIPPRGRLMNQLRGELLDGLERYGVGFRLLTGKSEDLLPGAGLLQLSRVPDRFHARLEEAGIIVPAYDSTDRQIYLRTTGKEAPMDKLDSFLGFCMGAATTILDVEHLMRAIRCIIGERTRR